MVTTTRPTLFELKRNSHRHLWNYSCFPPWKVFCMKLQTITMRPTTTTLVWSLDLKTPWFKPYLLTHSTAPKKTVQRPNEKPNEYYQRLLEVFKIHSGIEEPNNWADAGRPGPFETILCQAFLEGLHEDVWAAVKQSYIGWNDQCRMVTLRQHANHAY